MMGAAHETILLVVLWVNGSRTRQESRYRQGYKRALDGLKSTIAEIKPGRGRYRKKAEWLNHAGIMTFEGRKWTDENVRKAINGYSEVLKENE